MSTTACGAEPESGQDGKLRRSAIDGRTTRHLGYGLSQQRRKAIEMHFRLGQAAWHDAQDQAPRRRPVGAGFLLNLIAYNLIRIPN